MARRLGSTVTTMVVVLYCIGGVVLTVTSPLYEDNLPMWTRWVLLVIFAPFYVFALVNAFIVAFSMVRRWLGRPESR